MSSSKKSTTVRVHLLRHVLRHVLRLLLGAAASVSPNMAAAALERVFLTPPRRRLSSRERTWVQGAATHRLPFGDGELAAWSWGEGPVALLVHGWGGRGSQLGAYIGPLREAGFRVVTFDAPGHGQSSGRRSSLVAMGEAVHAVARGLGPVDLVVAHSAGAAAATIALSSGLTAKKAVYVAPPIDLGTFLYSVAGQLGLQPTIAQRTQERIERRLGVQWSDLRGPALARGLTVPLLVFHDRHDRQVRWSSAQELVHAWPGSRLVTTEGLGHSRILRDADVVSTATRFLAGGAAPTATVEILEG